MRQVFNGVWGRLLACGRLVTGLGGYSRICRPFAKRPQVNNLPYIATIILATSAWAQPPVAPTNEPTGNPNGENVANYNIRESFEAGYRFRETDGNNDMYRSTVNYGNGIRLLSSSLSVQSREGHGSYFDQILLTTLGLGNDPYQSASFRIEKNGLYRYELSWRSIAYFNPGL